MRRLVLVALVAALALVAVPAAASASVTVKLPRVCGTQTQFPAVFKIRATHVPQRTYGYAPRWLVGCSIAGQVQRYWRRHGDAPRRVEIYGARWYGGIWRIRYRVVTFAETDGEYSYTRITATKGRQRVVFNGYS